MSLWVYTFASNVIHNECKGLFHYEKNDAGMSNKKRLKAKKMEDDKTVIKAIQVAFDVGEKIQHAIRKEALERGINPSDRIRQILGLTVPHKPKRLRLSISLSDEDMAFLAKVYKIKGNDPVAVKHHAAKMLVAHVKTIKDEEL